jgi:uncharacterized protein YbjT (DUF2867 family)
MARVLVVGCGCRGQALASGLAERGHAVRGTSRDPRRFEDIAAAGAEPVIADPDRLGTVLPHLQGVTVVCWLMGPVPEPALHDERLRSMLEKLVDTPVRGFVYEDGGGADIVRQAEKTFRMPVAVVDEAPDDHDRWLHTMTSAVDRLLVP